MDMHTPPGSEPQASPRFAGAVVRYRIDGWDHIVEIGGAWESFAAENDGRAVAAANVLGRPLWDFITGPTTVLIWRQVLDHVRQIGVSVRFSYRCDSPQLRRFMRMAVSPQPKGGVLFESQLFRTEPRRMPLHVRLGDSATVARCSLCNFLQVRGVWTDVVDAVEIGLVMDQDLPVVVAYGICPRCRNLLAQTANDSLRTQARSTTFSSPLRTPSPAPNRKAPTPDSPRAEGRDQDSASDSAI
jgi:hypothetical protein